MKGKKIKIRWDAAALGAALFLTAVTLFRLWYCTTLDLVGDEAYYFLWSKHLDVSYFSKGPAVAWTIAFGTAVMGDTVFGIRWMSVLLAAGTGWQLFLLMRRLDDSRTAFASVLVAALVPLFAIGAVLMTIDPLSVFFWIWAANLFLDARLKNRARDWMWVGFAIGSGFLAKFINLLELACFIGFLAADRQDRRLLASRGPWLMVFTAFVCTLPVWYWNQSHGWITARHLQARGAIDHSFHFQPREFFQFWTDQALVQSPLLFLLLATALVVTLLRRNRSEAERFLLWISAPVFGFYIILALNDSGEANWTATGIIGLTGLGVMYWRRMIAVRPAWRWAVGAALLLAFVQVVLMHNTDPIRPLLKGKDPLDRARGWHTLAEQVEPYRGRYPNAALVGNHHQTASLLAFYLPDRPVTYLPNSDHIQNQFSFWPGYSTGPGRGILYVTDRPGEVPEQMKSEFSQVEEAGRFWTRHDGRRLREFAVYSCWNPASVKLPAVK